MKRDIANMSHAQFGTWVIPMVDCPLFESRERLVSLLAENADRDALVSEFREFYEGYCELAFELEGHEESLLSILRSNDIFAPLQRRVAIVEAARKTSPLGRQGRRMSDKPLRTDPRPEIEVSALSDDGFRALMETFANWGLFAARERIFKWQKATPSDAAAEQLKSEFLDFFVYYLELEQFLEDYDYDPDEGLELCPEVAERLERSVADYESGAVKTISIEEVAKKLGLKW